MGDFVLTAVKGVLKLVAAPAGLFLLLFLVAGLAMGWLVPILMTGKLVQREQVIIDLAGQTPVSITYHPCGTVGGMKGQAVKGEVSTHFPVCGARSRSGSGTSTLSAAWRPWTTSMRTLRRGAFASSTKSAS